MDERERQLEWERAWRQRVALCSIAAGVVLFAGALYGAIAIESKDPTVGLVQGLGPALAGQARAAIDPHTAHEAFVDHHAIGLVLATVIVGLGTLAMLPVLRYLYAATRFRRPEMSLMAKVFATAGPAIAAVLGVAAEVVYVIAAHHYVTHADRSHHAVDVAMNSGARIALGSIATAGQLAIAVAFVMIPLSAMRVGLLSRFMGVLGIISGALFIIPITPLPLVQTFWLVGFGVMLSGWGNIELGPAWTSGEARPWPTQQQLREERGRAKGRGRPSNAPAPAPAPAAPSKQSPSASKKRKRKRR